MNTRRMLEILQYKTTTGDARRLKANMREDVPSVNSSFDELLGQMPSGRKAGGQRMRGSQKKALI